MDLYIQGKRQRVTLTRKEFKASGGEADVYLKGGTAYKIYHDPNSMIPTGKIQELSVLTLPNIVKPQDILLNAQNQPVGYPMRAIDNALPLIQTFTPAFRDREGLTPDTVVGLVRKLREGVQHVHDNGLLIVDLNELNFLVRSDFKELFFIDVDSYQTPHFPAPVLMESVRDRHCTDGRWSTGTDWFSFAVVTFQLFVGIHPYRGKHPTLKGLDERMLANRSVLNAEVTVPAATLPLSVIPANYRAWYQAVFEQGQRVPPPTGTTDVIVLIPVPAARPQGNSSYTITEQATYEFGDVTRFVRGFVLTTDGIYEGTRRLAALPATGCQLAITPRENHAILAWRDAGAVRLFDATTRQEIALTLNADALMSAGGRLFIHRGTMLEEIEFVESGSRILARARHIGNVLEQATQLFEGVAFQNLLGACYASFFPRPFQCQQVRIKELDGLRLLDARREGRVLMVVGERAGKIDLFVMRFSEDGESYDIRRVADIAYSGLNFAVLDSGICAHMASSEVMEIFSHQKDSLAVREIDDPSVRGDIRLFANGAQVLFARGKSLYRLSVGR